MQPLQNPQPMRAAVIGLGRVGYLFGLEEERVQPASHVACYDALENIEEIMLCDSDKKVLDAARLHFYIANEAKERFYFVDDYKKLDSFQPEIVSVCTPTPTHKEVVCEVAKCESVKAIFLEKPIAQSLQDADEIINTCKNAHVKLTVNHTRRWDPMYLKLISELEECPHTVIGIHPGPLIRTGIHMLDLFNWIIPGQPRTVQAFGPPQTNYVVRDLVQIDETDENSWIDYSVNGCISYANTEAILYGSVPAEKLVLFEFDVFMPTRRMRMIKNGAQMEEYTVRASHRYSGLNEYGLCNVYCEDVKQEAPLLTAVKEVCSSSMNSCTGEAARSALHLALGLHWSAMHKGEVVKLKDVSKDFTVRSY